MTWAEATAGGSPTARRAPGVGGKSVSGFAERGGRPAVPRLGRTIRASRRARRRTDQAGGRPRGDETAHPASPFRAAPAWSGADWGCLGCARPAGPAPGCAPPARQRSHAPGSRRRAMHPQPDHALKSLTACTLFLFGGWQRVVEIQRHLLHRFVFVLAHHRPAASR